MPLIKSPTNAAFKSNVAELMHSNKKRKIKQALAIAYKVKGKAGGGY